jgi:Ni/Fe-hydrogenase subunit HybB-like protein
MVFERLKWPRAVRIQRLFTVPLVILGVILSTLHQSSLGSLYLIVPEKLHPLWYTPLLPVMFWVSSVAVGLAMVIVESRLSARAFGRHLELPLLSEVGRVLVAALALLAVFRAYDLVSRGVIGQVFQISYESLMFQLEILVGLVAPIAMLSSHRLRQNARGLYAASLCVVLGFIVNRMNVSITGFEGAAGGRYVPAWSEAVITLMLVAIGFAAFALAVRYFNVFPEPEETEKVYPGGAGTR